MSADHSALGVVVREAREDDVSELRRRYADSVRRTEASELSRPLFARFGFSGVGVETVDRSGVGFERFRMEKRVDTEPEGRSSG